MAAEGQLRTGDMGLAHELASDARRRTRVGRVLDLSLVWVLPALWRGWKQPVQEREVPRHPAGDETAFLAARSSQLWAAELERKGPQRASLLRGVMLRLQAFELGLGVFVSVLQGLLFSVARPLLLGSIIDVVSDPTATTAYGAQLAVAFAIVILFEGIFQSQAKQLLSCRVGSRFLCWISSLVHRKSMTVSAAAVSRSGLQETSLIGGDVSRMIEEWRWLCVFPFVLVALVGGVVVLAVTLGNACLVGFAIMAVIVAINLKLTAITGEVEKEDFAFGDKRIGILREILNGIKAIKMMAWERPFQRHLVSVRHKEAERIATFRTIMVSSINLGRASPVLAASFSILTLALTEPDSLTASRIFVAISSFQGLRLPLIAITQHLTFFSNLLVSFGRLQHYLTLDDAAPPKPLARGEPLAAHLDGVTCAWSPFVNIPGPATKVDGATVAVESESASNGLLPQFTMHNITLSVRSDNHLVAVVGKVGSGKSSLLSTVMGSMYVEKGDHSLSERTAYVPQKPFIMSGTVSDNVRMGKPFDQDLFDRVLRASALDVDLQSLPNGVDSEIGERGQTLSGGQAARLSIARALYFESDLLILDDPLSAVDPEVANNLFRRSVLGFLGRYGTLYKSGQEEPQGARPRRSVLMTLNQLHLLPYFDHVVVLDQGKIVEQGTFQDLVAHQDGTLAKMVEGLEGVQHLTQESLEQELDAAYRAEEQNAVAGHHPASEAANQFAPAPGSQPAPADESAVSRPPTVAGTAPAVSSTAAIAAVADGKAANLAEPASATVSEQDIQIVEHPADAPAKDSTAKEKDEHHILIAREGGQKGAISRSIIFEYLRAMGYRRVPFSFLFAIFAYSMMAVADLVLANWIRKTQTDSESFDHMRNAGLYIGLSLLHVIGLETLSLHNTRASVQASKNVHDSCIDNILHGVIQWFEATPSGRVLSRFSGDMAMIDRQLAFIFDDLFQFTFLLIALCVVICYIVPKLIGVVIVGILLFLWQTAVVDSTNREVKRYANQALAPVLTNISEAIGARELIRCMQLEGYFCARHFMHTDRYTSNLYFSLTLVNFSTMMAGLVSFALSTSAALIVVFRREDFEPALVGLALTYSFLIPYFLGILSIILPMGLSALTSLERVLEYKGNEVPQEAPWDQPVDEQLLAGRDSAMHQADSKAWPWSGAIEFQDVTLVYRPELPPALLGLSFRINGGEKIGVCGRTGAGKSSLTMLLFRIHEAAEGRVLIDGQDIQHVGLQLLRSSLTIIPQTPLLLEGSLRNNLDPFSEYSEEQLVAALRKVGLSPELLQLSNVVAPSKSSSTKKLKKKKKSSTAPAASEAGLSLSVGERQLLSLARAILRDPRSQRIIVLDEPTSSLDRSTDETIQAVVRREFQSSTMLTIAHRLGSIIDSDRILVMERGRVAEFDAPAKLLANPTGRLRAMVDALGPATAASLDARARSAGGSGGAAV